MHIKVSIVVPVYNVEPYIRQCLDSLINQSLKEIEIILINDYSPDSCGKICDEYAAKDERVIVIHNKKNRGASESSNTGIQAARGAYIGFVDPDDWVDRDYFERLYNAAYQSNADVAKAERKRVLENNTVIHESRHNKLIRKRIKRKHPVFLSFSNQHTTAIYKRDLLAKHHILYPDIPNAQDNVFLLKVGYFAQSIVTVSKTYYYYRKRSGSLTEVKSKSYFESIIQFLELSLVFINKHEMEKKHYDAVFMRSFNLAHKRYNQLLRVGHLADYRREYLRNILELLTLYKYNHTELLDGLIFGFRFHVMLKSKKPRLYAFLTTLLRLRRLV